MLIRNKKTQKIISFLLIISILAPTVLFSKPKQTSAVFGVSDIVFDIPQTILKSIGNAFQGTTSVATVTDTALSVKDWAMEIVKQLLMAVARRALQEVTKSTINWINGGFHGSPLFLENPQSFFEDIAKSEVKNLVDAIGYDTFRFPFGKQTALGVIDSYKRQFETNAQYSLSKVINDPVLLAQYRNDFNYGGWNGFLINTQYPQNNYLGFQMMVQENLASRVEGTLTAPANKVKDLLAQGQGFLSPQTCPSNPDYNNGVNEWRQPSFDQAEFNKTHNYDLSSQEGQNAWNLALAKAKAEWAKKNTCPEGLVNTTPGAVVADQIKISLGSSVRQQELAAAMGNSLSAIFDALINKFINDGLNSLASRVNPPPAEDNWSYDGQTLGSPVEEGPNSDWYSGPEQVIDLAKFKKQISGKTIVNENVVELIPDSVIETTSLNTTEEIGNTGNGKYIPGDIANTERELQLMSEITKFFSQIWPEARKLDICIPGPDIGWQERLQNEMDKNSRKLQSLFTTGSEKEASAADLAFRELKFAVGFFKDWINNKMITELPSSILFIEAVADIKALSQQSDELTDAKRLKNQALARLRAIETGLATIKTQPARGSAQEKILISLKKQYDGTRFTITSVTSLSDRQNELDVVKDKFESLKKFTDPSNPQGCPAERKAKGWGLPGGWQSSLSGGTTTQTLTSAAISTLKGLAPNSEQAIFCSLPIIGGYNHETFLNTTGITHPEMPMVNAKKVSRYETTTIKSFLSSLPGNHSTAAYINIKISCNVIFNAKLLDYKGNLPGLTIVTETSGPPPDETDATNSGTCTYPARPDGVIPTPDTDISREDCDLNDGTWSQNSGDGNTGGDIPLPEDIGTKHGNHAAEVATAKQVLTVNDGMVFSKTSSACDRFKITKEAVSLIGGSGNSAAGFLSDSSGSNCGGYAVDAIAFPDGYVYQVLDETASDGNGPIWNPASCGPLDGNGTCPERYRAP